MKENRESFDRNSDEEGRKNKTKDNKTEMEGPIAPVKDNTNLFGSVIGGYGGPIIMMGTW